MDSFKPSQYGQLLDHSISIKSQANKFYTGLYEKPHNLYLYIPPHSAHPPRMIRRLIFGVIQRIVTLTSQQQDCVASIMRQQWLDARRLCKLDRMTWCVVLQL